LLMLDYRAGSNISRKKREDFGTIKMY